MGKVKSHSIIKILILGLIISLSIGPFIALAGESLRRGETRQTLSPEFFKDPYVKRAYQVAKEIPWVLDSIYCYCYCEESPVFRHKSLLSCYVDEHASL